MKNLECITLFVEDLAQHRRSSTPGDLDLKIVYEDPVSAVFQLEIVMINLLKISEAPKSLIVPAKVADSSAGQAAHVHSLRVPNVDEVCGKAQDPGRSALLNGPQGQALGTPHPLPLRIPQAMSGSLRARDTEETPN